MSKAPSWQSENEQCEKHSEKAHSERYMMAHDSSAQSLLHVFDPAQR